MMHEIETAATKTKNAVADARDQVADRGDRLERIARAAFHALPLLPERTFEFVLDRMGLMRKTSGFGAAAIFAGGFVAGSVTTALTTPVSGAVLRRKIGRTVASWTKEASESSAVEGAKELATEAKKAVENGAAKVAKVEHAVEAKLKGGAQGEPKHPNGSTSRAHRS